MNHQDGRTAPGAEIPMTRLFEERERSIDAHHRIQRFFLELDRRSDPRTAAPSLRAPIEHLLRRLDARAGYRAYFAGLSPPEGIDLRLPNDADVGVARDVSAIFVESARELDGHAWDLAPLAFELFVSGRLVTAHPEPRMQERLCIHGAPDGWNYFLFAELGFVCVDAGVDAAFWDPLLVALVATCDLLAHNGRGELAARQPSELRSARFAQWDGRVLPMAEVQRVRALYRARVAGLAGLERRRHLADLFAHALGLAGFTRFSRVFAVPGARRALLEPAVLATRSGPPPPPRASAG